MVFFFILVVIIFLDLVPCGDLPRSLVDLIIP